MIKIRFHRRGDRVRLVAAGVLLAAFCAVPAMAQQSQPADNIGGLKLTAPVLWAAAGIPARAAGGAAQAPSTDPVLAFFQNTEISGFVDGYYLYNFTSKANPGLRAFDTIHNSFSLNLVELAFERKPTSDSRAGYRIDLDYGPTAGIVNFFNAGGIQGLQQAYVSYMAPIGSGLQLDFGRFVTPHGAEVIETKDNMNYSRSLLFTYAIPFAHTGLRASYAVNDMVSVMGFLVNGWDSNVDDTIGKTSGVMVMLKPVEALSIVGNYMGGTELDPAANAVWRHMFDATISYTVTPRATFVVNLDHGTQDNTGGSVKWQGGAAYLKLQARDWFALTPRFEIFEDADGARTGTGQTAKEVSITADLKDRDGVRLFLEYRRDFSNVDFFVDDTGAPVKNQNTFTIGVVYAFSSKTP